MGLLLLFFCLFIGVLVVIWTLMNGISPMPSSPKAKEAICSLISKEMSGVILDLGSGWGGLAYRLAREFPNAQVIGYENSPIPYFVSKWRKLPNLTLKRKNFYRVSLTDADVIVCYLYPGAMVKLKEKMERELKEGTWVISSTFAVPGWKPLEVRELNDLFQTKIYLYHFKNK